MDGRGYKLTWRYEDLVLVREHGFVLDPDFIQPKLEWIPNSGSPGSPIEIKWY